MIESGKPRKQRIFRYSAPMHLRQHMVNAHISKQLSEKLGIKKRSIAVLERLPAKHRLRNILAGLLVNAHVSR